MSPVSRIWFIAYDDGTVDYNLPQDIAGYVDTYCQLQYSLIHRPSISKAPPPTSAWLTLTAVPKTSTTLRVLSPGYSYGISEYWKSK